MEDADSDADRSRFSYVNILSYRHILPFFKRAGYAFLRVRMRMLC